jgi:hypothetical protein
LPVYRSRLRCISGGGRSARPKDDPQSVMGEGTVHALDRRRNRGSAALRVERIFHRLWNGVGRCCGMLVWR